jgi:hypothetical protein
VSAIQIRPIRDLPLTEPATSVAVEHFHRERPDQHVHARERPNWQAGSDLDLGAQWFCHRGRMSGRPPRNLGAAASPATASDPRAS